jgi:site-specific recombinase XerD
MDDQNELLKPIGGLASPFLVLAPIQPDGREGTNRAIGNQPQIAANTDVDAIKVWLARFIDTPTTFNNYRKEAERLVLWATLSLRKPVSSLTHEDLLVYEHFLADPQPTTQWVMARGRKVARGHKDWRPFAGPLAPTSRRQSIIILNTMFSWLVAAGYLAGNPLSLSRQRARKAKPRVTRYLDDGAWAQVKLAIETLPRSTEREREHYCRLRWLFSLLYLCGLRISEVTQNTMGGFFYRRDNSGHERWWLEVTGKGDKKRIVPATNELMAELALYRCAKGFAPLPSVDETTPLLLPIGHQTRTLTRAAVHAMVKHVFKQAAAGIRAQGTHLEAQAQQLEQASAHWLRHTAGSNMANNNVDLRHVRDNLGHESISTTNAYLHSSDDQRHQATEEKHRMNW